MLGKKPIIGITLGDFNGIGPETIVKVLKDNRINKHCTIIVYGHPGIFAQQRKQLKLDNFSLNKIDESFSKLHHKKPNILVCWEQNYQIDLGVPSKDSAQAALTAIRTAANHLKEEKIRCCCNCTN